MNASALQFGSDHAAALSQAGAATRAPTPAGGGFGAAMGGALGAPDSPEEARAAAEEFVAIAFVEPVLKSLRESNDAAAPFAPGDAEKTFAPLFDAEIARRVVQREDYDLVDAVARQLLANRQAPGDIAAPGIDTHG